MSSQPVLTGKPLKLQQRERRGDIEQYSISNKSDFLHGIPHFRRDERRMQNRVSRAIVAILITAMIVAAIPTIMAASPPAPAIWITPDNLSFETTHTHVGDKFNVTVMVDTNGLSYVWQAKVDFNASQINAVRAAYTGTGKSLFFTGHNVIPVTPTIDNATGYVVHGESLMGSDSVAAGTNSLFWIEFQIVAAPAEGETLTSQISVEDPALTNTFILDPDLLNVSGPNVGSATYTFSPPPPVRDVAVTALSFSKDVPKFGDNITITVNVLNNGTISETFEIRIAFDSTPIATLNGVSLGAGEAKVLTYEWNTSDGAVGKHNITASATVVPFDIDPDNNSKIKPITIMSTSGPMTDINGDGKVNMKDIAIVAQAFGTHKEDGRWNPLADANGDGYVNLFDIALVAKDFWKQ